MWIHDLYSALRSGQGGVKPLQPVSRVPGFGGSSSTITEERGLGRAGSSAQQQQPGGGRLMEVLRRGLGRRLQEEEQEGVGGRQLLQAQRHQCVRSKVTF
jgi:hypothetical protein